MLALRPGAGEGSTGPGEPTAARRAPSEMDAMRRSHEVYGFITDVSELARRRLVRQPDLGDRRTAPKSFAETVADGVLELVERVFRARDIRHGAAARRPARHDGRQENR